MRMLENMSEFYWRIALGQLRCQKCGPLICEWIALLPGDGFLKWLKMLFGRAWQKASNLSYFSIEGVMRL